MWAVDYPYQDHPDAVDFLDAARIPEKDKQPREAQLRPVEVRPVEVCLAEVRIDVRIILAPDVPSSNPFPKLTDVIVVGHERPSSNSSREWAAGPLHHLKKIRRASRGSACVRQFSLCYCYYQAKSASGHKLLPTVATATAVARQ